MTITFWLISQNQHLLNAQTKEQKVGLLTPKVLKIKMMKPVIKKIINRSVFFTLLSFISTSGFAQFPDLISYQTIIRNSNNELVANTSIGVLISILSGSEANVLWYQEEHTVKTNINGLAYIIIGKGSIHNGTMSGIDWSKGPFYIKSETDPQGGNNYTLVVVSQMLSVPYAIFAKSAENVTGPITELDPQFNASISKGIHAVDTAAWNRKLSNYTETDPLFYASISSGITAADTTNWNKNLNSHLETIGVINASIVGGIINSADTAAWYKFLRSNIEKDPLFYASISRGITAADTAAWNKKLSSYTETEPLFNASISKGIHAVDTAAWNKKLSSYTETDPLFYASISSGITAADTAAWNHILYLSDNIIFTSGKSIKLNISDTFTMLANYRIGIANKLNISDTASMLANYRNVNASKLNVSDTTIMLTNVRANISSKLNISDTATMLANYRNVNASKLNISDTTVMLTNLRANISSKLNVSDTATMLANYRNFNASKLNISDTATMLRNYRNVNASKLNVSDTTIMLTNLRANISSKLNVSDTTIMLTNVRANISSKLNISDTATMLANYRNVNASKFNVSDTTIMLTNVRANISSKLNISDTATMLANYRNSNATKLNISDTSSMLFPYLRKADLNTSTISYVLANADRYNSISANTEIFTQSTTDVLATGMSFTPTAGNYIVNFNSEYSIEPTDITGQAQIDLNAAYLNLWLRPVTNRTLSYGAGVTLSPGVYYNAGAVTTTGTLTLDAGGDPNAEFIFKFGAAYSTAAASTVVLTNGASACNVYWVAEGAIALGANTVMKGMLISNSGAVSLGNMSQLQGNLFSTAGAITIDGSVVSKTTGCTNNFGSLNNFLIFSKSGVISNTGASYITGDIATNTGTISGFESANFIGSIHAPGASIATANFSVYQNGTLIPFSSRKRKSTLNLSEITLQAIASVNEGGSIEIRWNVALGTVKMQQRILTIQQVR